MDHINWGIIGCGDVTEVKSGPAFNKVPRSSLVAVMSRNAAKAEDYAKRHHVPKWYTDAHLLIRDPAVNAIYVATPPSSHETYAIAALEAGKPVYVEKPMSLTAHSARKIVEAAVHNGQKLTVAHYRRAQPLFSYIKGLISQGAIGQVRYARLELVKPLLTETEMQQPGKAWRIDKSIAGGGIFHDLAPHQLDLLYHFFGRPSRTTGLAINQARAYETDDIVTGSILFESGVMFSGLWCFNAGANHDRDLCEITGDKGKISFSFFEHQPIIVEKGGATETFHFDRLDHVQQPMIGRVVDYFLNRGDNPCSGEDGVTVMEMIDQLTGGH